MMDTHGMNRFLLLLLIACACASYSKASPVIDDPGLRTQLLNHLSKVADRNEHVTGKELAGQMDAARKHSLAAAIPLAESDGKMDYDDEAKGVVMLGSVYKCGKCDKWHLGGAATGWVLTADGLIVTNDHIFRDATRETYGILALDGKFAEVIKVEAADRAADIAVVRVKGDGFTPLPVAKRVHVGEPVHVISHPDGKFFTYTAGRISRLYKQTGKGRAATWMAITADYARGSSGGPVLNDRGEVIGMVSSTKSIYYGTKPGGNSGDKKKNQDKGPLQMVLKNCVSLPELQRVLGIEGGTKGPEPGK